MLRQFLIAVAIASIGASAAGGAPFVAADTSRLMGSPEPLPLIEIEPAFPNLKIDRPVQITHSGDGTDRLFVPTQGGAIYVVPNNTQATQAEMFLDLRDTIGRVGGDNGLMSIAFPPGFSGKREFYVVHVAPKRPKFTVVSRYRVSPDDPNRADPSSEKTVLRIAQPFNDHNAACLKFGPDGFLYVALGDGGWNRTNRNAQDLSTLLGGVLRIDVRRPSADRPYAIPPDNPFVERAGARPEIWAYGLRAPWRISFDRLTGALWTGDNGQVEAEEINLVLPGKNYGWPDREGDHPFNPTTVTDRGRPIGKAQPAKQPTEDDRHPFADPVVAYDHTKGKSVVGGYVYRGRKLPELFGAYLYADYQIGNIWALRWDGVKVTENKLIARSRRKITSFGEDESGELLLTAFDGRIYRMKRSNQRPPDKPFPIRLSETGLFTSTEALTPGPGLIPYSVNVPLWSDGARKERYLALPAAGKVRFKANGAWEFPVGSVFVKTFQMARRRLETRLLVRSQRGWDGYTYLWNADQTDATLLDGAHREKLNDSQTWYYPSRADCIACHTAASGFVLGLRTEQMHRNDQIHTLAKQGVFANREDIGQLRSFPDWEKSSGSIVRRARAYLDVNCAMCHTPPGFTKIDLRFSTPLESAHLLHHEPEKPRLGPTDSKLIVPGEPSRSELLLRMKSRGAGRMPNLATSVVDEEAANLVGQWIRSLGAKDEAPRP